MQTFVKTELNVLINSNNMDTSKSQTDLSVPFCRKKLDFTNPIGIDQSICDNFNQSPVNRKQSKKSTAIVTGTIQSSFNNNNSNETLSLSKSNFRNQFQKAPSNSKRNARERRRVRTINDYFSQLQKFLPYTKSPSIQVPSSTGSKKMSKVETLKAAIEYIEYLVKYAPANQQYCHINSSSSPTSSSASSQLSSPTSSVTSSSSIKSLNKSKSSSPATLQNSSFNLSNSSACSSPASLSIVSNSKNITLKANITMSQSQTTLVNSPQASVCSAYDSSNSSTYFNSQTTQQYSQATSNAYNYNYNDYTNYGSSPSYYYNNQNQYSSQYPIDVSQAYNENNVQSVQPMTNSYNYYIEPNGSELGSPSKAISYQSNVYQYCSKQQFDLKTELYLNEVDSNKIVGIDYH